MTEDLEEMLSQLDLTPAASDMNVSLLSEQELIKRYNASERKLRQLKQVTSATDQEGRDEHAIHGALKYEMKRRRLV
jgi:hypothetical protein